MQPHQIDAAIAALHRRHPELDAGQLRSWVLAEVDRRRDVRVHDFLPVFVTRAVEDRIRADVS